MKAMGNKRNYILLIRRPKKATLEYIKGIV